MYNPLLSVMYIHVYSSTETSYTSITYGQKRAIFTALPTYFILYVKYVLVFRFKVKI